MQQKKWLVVWSSLLVIMALLVGCSTAELGFYNLSKEISTVQMEKPIESTGEISLQLDGLPADLTGSMTKEEAKNLELVQNTLKSYTLTYKTLYDAKSNKMEANIYVKDKAKNTEQLLMAILRKDHKTYVKIDAYVDFIKGLVKQFGTGEEVAKFDDEVDQIIGNAKYISMSDEELIQFFTNINQLSSQATGGDPVLVQQQQMNLASLRNALDPVQAEKQQKLVQKFMDGLVEKVYNQYDMKVIEQSQNKYTFTLTTDNLGEVVSSFLGYTVDNAEGLGTYLKDFLGGLNTEEAAMLQTLLPIGAINKEAFNVGIDQAVNEVVQGRQDMKQQIQGMQLMLQPMLKNTLADSKIQVSYEKKDPNIYESTSTAKININDPDTKEKIIDLMLSVRDTTKVISTFDVTTPTEGVISFTELESKMPTKMAIYVDESNYSLTKGFTPSFGEIDVKLIQGRSYLPMRKVAEAFGEKVVWDAKAKKAYVEKNGKRIVLDGKLIGSTYYIKTRDFEKLGYTVEWDAETHTASIIKSKAVERK